MNEEINYEDKLRNYSLAELEDVKQSINRENYPDRYELILKQIERRKVSPNTNIIEENKSDDVFFPDWKKNIVNDEISPVLYSRHAVYGFCVLFTVMFGGVLLISNLKVIQNPRAVKIIWTYVIIYTVFTLIMIFTFPNTHNLGLMLNIVGAIPLYSYFWKIFIGREFIYRKKSITKPLVISFIIIIPFFLVMFL